MNKNTLPREGCKDHPTLQKLRASSIQGQSWLRASAAATLHPRRFQALHGHPVFARKLLATRDGGSSASKDAGDE